MRFVILGMLVDAPLSLYDVRQRFLGTISLFYSASFGSIQRALRLLVEEGHLAVDEDPESPRGRRLYRITPAGRSAWEHWMTSPVTGADLERDMLARVFFLGRLPDARTRADVLASLTERVEEGAARLRAMASPSSPRDDDPVLGYQLATLHYGISSHESALAWLRALQKKEEGT